MIFIVRHNLSGIKIPLHFFNTISAQAQKYLLITPRSSARLGLPLHDQSYIICLFHCHGHSLLLIHQIAHGGRMKGDKTTEQVRDIMLDFARLTGLAPAGVHPRRYLWTDAFAVCNYLGLYETTCDDLYRDLALGLVDQVHHILGRHREDDPRKGWISGLDEKSGELHPTRGGLRIGKQLNERKPGESFDERLEWDRDGQYYHYLTKWMHALNRVSRVTGDPTYTGWGIDLAKTAHARFTYIPHSGGRKRMYWKMSIDLSHPLVPSMGQHDPLDGFVTYSELQETAAAMNAGQSLMPDMSAEVAEMAEICRGTGLVTNDPLGIGGLLFDASRMAQLIMSGSNYGSLLENVVDSALVGMEAFVKDGSLLHPAGYRLAFRELGLSIGLSGIEKIFACIEENPRRFGNNSALERGVKALAGYLPLGKDIERFWMDDNNRRASTWADHRDINMVMLATSLAPEGFLLI